MRARGLSYAEIGKQLQVSRASIGSDVQYLREQAKGTIREYATEHLPEQYQVCLSALDTILKYAFEILETSHNNRKKAASNGTIQGYTSAEAGIVIQCYNHR
jgi:hypothetical protein